MNTDKIYAESIANEYSTKKTSKVVALKKLDRKAYCAGFSFGGTAKACQHDAYSRYYDGGLYDI